MSRLRGALLVFGLLAVAANLHAQPPSPDARGLAASMQVVEQTRAGIEALVHKRMQEGLATQEELECTKRANLDFAIDAYAAAISAALSPDEIKDAIKFFDSPEGRGYLRYSRTLELKSRGLANPDPKPDLTPAETRATTKFMERSAGKKLLNEHVLETPELKGSLLPGMRKLIESCASPANSL